MNKKNSLRQLGAAVPLALACTLAWSQTAGTPPVGRLLASNCFQCHGTNGRSSTGFETLAGKSASEIYNELREMQFKSNPNIMEVHARGYSDTQLRQLSQYFSTLK